MNFDKYPKRYRAEFIEPGVISYQDVGQGMVFVSREALSRMIPSFIGKPVVNVEHKDLTVEQAFKLTDEEVEALADGVVYDCGWLENGWKFCDFIVWDLETQKNIDENGFSVSCAYKPSEVGKGGSWHNIPYDEEVINGNYTHLAIVINPRYEKSKVYELPKEYQNSLSDELVNILTKKNKESKMGGEKSGKKVFFFFDQKKNSVEDKPAIEEEKINAEEAVVDIDGKQVSLKDLITTYQAEQAEILKKEELAKNMLNPDDEIEVDGKKVLISALVDAYNKCNAAKNGIEASKYDQGAVQNEVAEDEKKTEEEKAKENALKKDNFLKVQKALNNAGAFAPNKPKTADQRIAAGNAKYGRKEAK